MPEPGIRAARTDRVSAVGHPAVLVGGDRRGRRRQVDAPRSPPRKAGTHPDRLQDLADDLTRSEEEPRPSMFAVIVTGEHAERATQGPRGRRSRSAYARPRRSSRTRAGPTRTSSSTKTTASAPAGRGADGRAHERVHERARPGHWNAPARKRERSLEAEREERRAHSTSTTAGTSPTRTGGIERHRAKPSTRSTSASASGRTPGRGRTEPSRSPRRGGRRLTIAGAR